MNETRTIRFIRRGELVSLTNVPPARTLLEALREDLGCTGTKEGCAEGDCGACTVVLAEPGDGGLRYRAINSCIRPVHAIDGMALWTVEDLAQPDGTLHPAQEAMVQCHGSQCGFCTPGFVMSLFGSYQNHVLRGEPMTRELAQRELSGNLCRCTGYRPILDAAVKMAELPPVRIDEAALVAQLEALDSGLRRNDEGAYLAPRTLGDLLAARAAHPDAQIVAGCTDVGLWITKQHRQFDRILDVSRVAELRRVETDPDHVAIGAAVTLEDAFTALVAERPQLATFAGRFAGLPVRNAGTLGGNVANGSPIGDSMPLLIALGATVVLQSVHGRREMPVEDFYTGYRKNVLAGDEVLAWVKVPRPVTPGHARPHPNPPPEGEGEDQAPSGAAGRPSDQVPSGAAGLSSGQVPSGAAGLSPSPPGGGLGWGRRAPSLQASEEFLRAYKVSRRCDDDISAVCLVIRIEVDDAGIVRTASIGAGGVAATPVRARQAEAALLGQPWNEATATKAATALRAEFRPISDMRASAGYRSLVLGNLMQRFWLESQGQSVDLQEVAA